MRKPRGRSDLLVARYINQPLFARILDGHWISPADDWFHYTANGRPRLAPAVHPCPWNRQTIFEGALDEGQSDDAQVLEHPRPKTHLSPHPPSYTLCEMTYRTFSRQMGEILGPAMRNIVRKIVMECAADGTDPAVRANRMTLEDVMRELRDESSWYNGIDWLERRANERLAERRRAKERDEDDSSSSSHSTGSHTTSPVLSTTTLQTTPSPPPSGKEDDALASSPMATAPPVLTSPLLKSPDIIRMIPYVPVTAQHLPYYSIEAFGYVRISGAINATLIIDAVVLPLRCGARRVPRYISANARSASGLC